MITFEIVTDEHRYAPRAPVRIISQQQGLYATALSREGEHDLLRCGQPTQRLRILAEHTAVHTHPATRCNPILLLRQQLQHFATPAMLPLAARSHRCTVSTCQYIGQPVLRHFLLVVIYRSGSLSTNTRQAQDCKHQYKSSGFHISAF